MVAAGDEDRDAREQGRGKRTEPARCAASKASRKETRFLGILVALGKHRNFGQTNVRVSPRKSASDCLILPIDRIWPAERRAMRQKPENSAQSDISAALIALRAT